MRAVALLVVVVAASLLAGCFGAASGPGIPEHALSAKAWGREGAPQGKTLYGVAELWQQKYGPAGRGAFGGALVVSVTDVPILDERDHVPGQLEAYQRAEGITLRKTGSEALTLANIGMEATADVYDVEGGGVPAKAIIVQVYCEDPDALVVAVGYGALPSTGGLLGKASLDIYGQARGLVAALACRA